MNDQSERDKEAAYMTGIIDAWRVRTPLEEATGGDWLDFHPDHKPYFGCNRYRIKPQPVEAWAVVRDEQQLAVYLSEEKAKLFAAGNTTCVDKPCSIVRLTEPKGD